MTPGHQHHVVNLPRWAIWILQTPIWRTRNLEWVDRSRFPFGSHPRTHFVDFDAEVWYLTILAVLHGWFGLSVRRRPSRCTRIYLEPRDWWVGYYRGDQHHYVCLLPCVVIRWNRNIGNYR